MPISQIYWFTHIIKKLLHSIISNRILFIFLFGLIVAILSCSQAKADCTVSGQNYGIYHYNSSNIMSLASINLTGTITCSRLIFPATNRRICMVANFNNRTSAVHGVSLPIQISGNVGGADNNGQPLTNNSWVGPDVTISSNNVLDYNFTISVPTQNTMIAYPVGTYNASATIFWDMQFNRLDCDMNTTSSLVNWDSGHMTINVSYTVPPFCQLNSTSAVNFGTISGIHPNIQYYDAIGAINSTCNLGTNYTIQLGNGNYYNAANAQRQMYNSNTKTYVPYSLYSNASRTMEWKANESISLNGLGVSQSSPVYGRLYNTSSLATIPSGSYRDSLVVTITY